MLLFLQQNKTSEWTSCLSDDLFQPQTKNLPGKLVLWGCFTAYRGLDSKTTSKRLVAEEKCKEQNSAIRLQGIMLTKCCTPKIFYAACAKQVNNSFCDQGIFATKEYFIFECIYFSAVQHLRASSFMIRQPRVLPFNPDVSLNALYIISLFCFWLHQWRI